MNKTIVVLVLVTCSCTKLLTPSEFTSQFPAHTTAKYYNQIEGNSALSSGKCKILIRDRKYITPLPVKIKEDMIYGAIGIDEWVEVDGGNAYILKNYEWVYLYMGDDRVGSRLVLYFDTMICR